MSALIESSFRILLESLDSEPNSAAVKYESLRLKISHLLRWRGCSDAHADELVDLTLDRLAAKLSAGEQVDNLSSYAAAIARFIWLEHSRRNKLDSVGDDLPELAVEPEFEEEPEPRMRCLRRCVVNLADDDRLIVVGYYEADAGEKAKHSRKRLAERLDLSMNALKVRACRLRMKLETCINDCVKRVTEARRAGTKQQEAM